jgi:hypothetical protein
MDFTSTSQKIPIIVVMKHANAAKVEWEKTLTQKLRLVLAPNIQAAFHVILVVPVTSQNPCLNECLTCVQLFQAVNPVSFLIQDPCLRYPLAVGYNSRLGF